MSWLFLFFPFLFSFPPTYMQFVVAHYYQDDEGDNAFHIAADSAKMIRENLEWIIVMLRYPDVAMEVRNHRQVTGSEIAFSCGLIILYRQVSKKELPFFKKNF